EDRRADPQVCRTVTYGIFEIAAHPCRDPGRVGLLGAYVGRDPGQPREGLARVPTEWRNPHDTAQLEPVGLLDARHQGRCVVGVAAGPAVRARRVETHLDEALQGTSALLRATAQAVDELGAVDGV